MLQPPLVCREQEEQEARRQELRRQEEEDAALLESHGLCALRAFPDLGAQCEGSDFCIQRKPYLHQCSYTAGRSLK